jgi:RNA polymerase sigma-70 factor, ECF subfamily
METTHRDDASDRALLTAVAGGDLAAFDRLYEIYAQRVFHYVRTLAVSASLAEEIVGDTMMAVWKGAGTFAHTSRVSTWILGIARHKAVDAKRRAGRHHREVNLDGAADLPHPQESAIEDIHRHDLASLMQRALVALSTEHQEILRLVFYEELPYEEIALLLSIPENTVKTRVYYAKQHLKQALVRQKEHLP